ncbi:MAG: hypothetical protein HQM14_11755 [SAR324 cluster bacterium]|nr:hypothetical protein [SAR324 cluster bacterium]
MGHKKQHLMLHSVMEGSSLLETPTGSTLFGCPPEILKQILFQKLPIPNSIVLPAKLYRRHCSQAAIEFVFFYYLFIHNGLEKYGKFRIFGTNSQCRLLKESIRIVLIGPTEKEICEQGMPKQLAVQLSKEMQYMALQNPKTNQNYTVDEVLDWNVLEVGQQSPLYPTTKDFSEIQLKRKGKSAYQVVTAKKSIDINLSFRKKQHPVYPIQHKAAKRTPDQLSLTILGNSDGFDPKNPANGYLFNFNNRLGIWDCPNYLHVQLKKLKIKFDQIEAIVLSHVHEDHLDVAESIRKDNPIDLFCTPEVYYSFLLKVQALMNCSHQKAKKYHRWHPISIDKPYSILGASFQFFYSVHAIPAVGSHITVGPKNQKKTILISGDHAPFGLIREMKEAGVLPETRFNEAINLIQGHEDLILIDAGGGTIHGNYEDYLQTEKSIHFMHTGELPIKLPESKSLVKHGQVIDLNSLSSY